jgi:hypothetical protein
VTARLLLVDFISTFEVQFMLKNANLRPNGAIRGKRTIIGWEGRGE